MKKINSIVAMLLLSSNLSAINTNDVKSKMGNIPIGNVGGSTGIVFPEGKSRFVIKHISLTKNGSYNGDDEINDPKKSEMNVDRSLFLYRYGLGNGFDIRVATTYKKNSQTQTILKGAMTGESFNLENSGMGDSQVITRYEILNQMKGAPLFLAVGAGMKLPTGSTNNSFSTPMGERQPKQTQPMQLGSGSYDYIAEIGASKIIPNSRIDAHLIYFLTTEGKNDYKFGDKLKWNLGYSYAITKYFNIQLELDGMHLAKNELEGNSVDSSGGNFIYLTPGIHIVPSKKFDLSLGYMHMVHRDNNYNSIDMVGGLSEDYRVIARLGYNF